MACSIVVLGAMVACGAPAPPATTATLPPVPAVRVAPVVAKGCEGRSGFVVEAPATVAASWDGAVTVGGPANLTFRNCGTAMLVVKQFTVAQEGGLVELHELAEDTSRLAPGASLEARARGSSRKSTSFVKAIAIVGGTSVEAETTFESVDDPKRASAIAACEARHGRFGPAGLRGMELCDAPTADAGKRCSSRAECESSCVADHTEVVPANTAGAPACGLRMEVRRTVGHCYERTLGFGCHAFIEDNPMQCVPIGGATRRSTTCVD